MISAVRLYGFLIRLPSQWLIQIVIVILWCHAIPLAVTGVMKLLYLDIHELNIQKYEQ